MSSEILMSEIQHICYNSFFHFKPLRLKKKEKKSCVVGHDVSLLA